MENKQELKHRIRVAMGQEPADIVFKNGQLVSTFTEEVIAADLAVACGKIVAIGHTGDAKATVDLRGAYVCPGFIDAHTHIESSMVSPEGFAEAVVPHGTAATVSDPHEIVNVLGLKGYEYMVRAAVGLPLDILFSIPSCVPATHMETSGGSLKAADIGKAHQLNPRTPALSEMMNFPGVYFGDDEVLSKICAARDLGLPIDGHSPMLGGKELNAYLNARILTDHECMTADEARDKLRRGMFVLMREGSAARNLKDLLPILSDRTAHRICIATDDSDPHELDGRGHLDHVWRELIRLGVDPLRALRILTINPAQLYRLDEMGGLGIGYRAHFFITDRIDKPAVKAVYHNGELVAENGVLRQPIARKEATEALHSVRLPKSFSERLKQYPQHGKVKVIGIIEGQILTEHLTGNAEDVAKGELAYLAVVERYNKNGNVGLGFIKGLGLKDGALASTVAHDHHNLLLAGKNLRDMEIAGKEAEKMGGGFVVVKGGVVKARLALPVGGLMSLANTKEVAAGVEAVGAAARELGVTMRSPFMVLSFMALSVIPHLKLTDMGVVDVDKFAIVPLEA